MDFGLKWDNISICYDNTSAINLTKNQTQHSSTKYIEIRHHFIYDHVQKGDTSLEFMIMDKKNYVYLCKVFKCKNVFFLFDLNYV
jgi:hypothetical protein